MASEIKLKPCPFCGSEAMFIDTAPNGPKSHKGYFVQCSNNLCGAIGLSSAIPEKAVAAWNRRPASPARRNAKTRMEYAVGYGKNHVLRSDAHNGENAYFDTAEEAREMIRRIEEFRRKMHTSSRRKFVVVFREVGTWREVGEGGHA